MAYRTGVEACILNLDRFCYIGFNKIDLNLYKVSHPLLCNNIFQCRCRVHFYCMIIIVPARNRTIVSVLLRMWHVPLFQFTVKMSDVSLFCLKNFPLFLLIYAPFCRRVVLLEILRGCQYRVFFCKNKFVSVFHLKYMLYTLKHSEYWEVGCTTTMGCQYVWLSVTHCFVSRIDCTIHCGALHSNSVHNPLQKGCERRGKFGCFQKKFRVRKITLNYELLLPLNVGNRNINNNLRF
jgi:hypothetical protein